jgi:hypothetical protein
MKTPRAAAFLALAASLASLCYLRADDGEERVAKNELLYDMSWIRN